MVAFPVSTEDAVKSLHAKALELGAADEGGPGHRSPDPADLYRAYFRDPDGNKLMVFAFNPA
jgi:predicted lactoylglutathione lyase